MTITRRTPLGEVAALVSESLRQAGIDAVLTGGASATIHSRGAYLSHDLDFIVRSTVTRALLDRAMSEVGFTRTGDRYTHLDSPFFVEFPRGPLAIGDDLAITPVDVRVGDGRVRSLSATDCCRDRLAAFYHWSDRQSLTVAIDVALRQRVSLRKIEAWSRSEGFQDKHLEFLRALKLKRDQRSGSR